MHNDIENELNRYGSGFLLVKQSSQCDCGWHQLIPVSKISGFRNRQDVHGSKERGWLLWDLLFNEVFLNFFFYQMFEEQNVKFYMNDGVTEIRGDGGKVALFI